MKKQPLLVHIIFHPASSDARQLARHIHAQLNEDPIVPGLRVPTVFCPLSDPAAPPVSLRFDFAERNFVILLADDDLNIDEAWCTFCGDAWAACAATSARCLPIQLSPNAFPLDPRLKELSFPKAHLHELGDARNAFVLRRLLVELCRYLSDLLEVAQSAFKAPVTIFLSHAKADLSKEPRVTEKLIDCLKQDQPIEAWFDSGDIPGGSKFAEAIEHGVQSASLLAVLTDVYATREWCREEVLLAKEHQRPVVVVDALKNYEVRSFPYLGNVPRIRWDGNSQMCIDLMLKETLRHLHALSILERHREPGDLISSRPPELATLIGLPLGSIVLYPDPPLGVGEARRLQKANVTITTPIQRLANKRPLKGQLVALSISESADTARYGMDPLHFESCMLDVSRYLLIKGATLAYGGYLGPDSYTEMLFELLRAYNALEGIQPVDRIVNHRGWPLPRLSVSEFSSAKDVSKIIELPRPPDVDESLHADFLAEPNFFPAEKSPEHRFAWARGMTAMRAFQADKARSGVVARVVIGGAFGPTKKKDGIDKWYASRIPGVLEEVLLSIQAGQPVFLVGAFGGAARVVGDLVRGVPRPEATWEYQQRAPHASAMKALYEKHRLPWMDYREIADLLKTTGKQGLNPLLSDEEQDELFDTADSLRSAALIITGLSRL